MRKLIHTSNESQQHDINKILKQVVNATTGEYQDQQKNIVLNPQKLRVKIFLSVHLIVQELWYKILCPLAHGWGLILNWNCAFVIVGHCFILLFVEEALAAVIGLVLLDDGLIIGESVGLVSEYFGFWLSLGLYVSIGLLNLLLFLLNYFGEDNFFHYWFDFPELSFY